MSDDNDHITYLISQAAWAEASTNIKNHPKARKHREIATRLRQLAAAEQQLTTATALLGECNDLLSSAIDLIEDAPCTDLSKCQHSGCKWTHKADTLITRIRAATKGTHP